MIDSQARTEALKLAYETSYKLEELEPVKYMRMTDEERLESLSQIYDLALLNYKFIIGYDKPLD